MSAPTPPDICALVAAIESGQDTKKRKGQFESVSHLGQCFTSWGIKEMQRARWPIFSKWLQAGQKSLNINFILFIQCKSLNVTHYCLKITGQLEVLQRNSGAVSQARAL